MEETELKPKRKRTRKISSQPVFGKRIPVDPSSLGPSAGFYVGQFRAGEVADLQQASPGLQDEIAMLRVAIRRCFTSATDVEGNDLEGWVKALSALGSASTRLAHLVQAQQVLTGGAGDGFLAVLSSALTDVRKEMGL
jgi:hypothetical protein